MQEVKQRLQEEVMDEEGAPEKTKHEEEAQRRCRLAAFQPQWFCESVLERAICMCVCLSARGRTEGMRGSQGQLPDRWRT